LKISVLGILGFEESDSLISVLRQSYCHCSNLFMHDTTHVSCHVAIIHYLSATYYSMCLLRLTIKYFFTWPK